MSIPKPKATYAPTSRASCKHCGQTINENTVRITQYERSPYHDGFVQNNHHLRCAYFLTNLDELRNWKTLRWDDQLKIYFKMGLQAPKETDPAIKERRAYVDRLWETRNIIEKNIDKKTIKLLVEANNRYQDSMKPPDILDVCAEGMAFGNTEPCPYCKNLTLSWEGDVCVCYGWYSPAVRCHYESKEPPKRYQWVIPESLKRHAFLSTWKAPYGKLPALSSASASGADGATATTPDATPTDPADSKTPPVDGDSQPAVDFDPDAPSEEEKDEDIPAGEELLGLSFAFLGKLPHTRAKIQEFVEAHAGTFQSKVDATTSHFVTVAEEVKKRAKSDQTKLALKQKIPIVTYDFLVDLAENRKVQLRSRKNLDPYLLGTEKGPKLPAVKDLKHKKRRVEDTSSSPVVASPTPTAPVVNKPTDKIEYGSDITKVDSDFGSGEIVLTDGDTVAWNAFLSKADMSTGVNSSYILQLVKRGASYYLFRKWGRMGGSTSDFEGDNTKTETFRSLPNACDAFREIFNKHTGNNWDNVHAFVQKPGKYNLIRLNRAISNKSGEKKTTGSTTTATEASKLHPSLKNFVDLIFDKTMMQRSLQQQNIDTSKINLESLSQEQIRSGYSILNEIQKLLQEDKEATKDVKLLELKFRDATTRFYSTIPHQFPPERPPPIINTSELLRQKIDLIESILSVSHASELMKEEDSKPKAKHPSDINYEALKCTLEHVDKSSTEFDIVRRYVENTHASTHSSYSLEIVDLFRAHRESEDPRFEKYKALHNHQLLWHGSRLMNWVGIISQGLRIAPPEAPVSGYMFGKGVYFADMVSKSANYCFTSASENTSVMMLCEVALGDYYERTTSEFLANESCLAQGKHSTWGIGRTQPNPAQAETIPDNVTVPLGKGINNPRAQSLLYNEFIVYDVAQIKMRYVMRMKFNYK